MSPLALFVSALIPIATLTLADRLYLSGHSFSSLGYAYGRVSWRGLIPWLYSSHLSVNRR